jgi:hypothetical protein
MKGSRFESGRRLSAICRGKALASTSLRAGTFWNTSLQMRVPTSPAKKRPFAGILVTQARKRLLGVVEGLSRHPTEGSSVTACVDAGRPHPDEQVVIPDHRLLDLPQFQDIG